ncbi:MAG: hypothetical protein AB2A00_19020 [Myxococcota bacterium]
MKRVLAPLVLWALVACGGSKAEQKPDETPAAPGGVDFKAMLAREVGPLQPQDVSSENLWFAGKIEGTGPVTITPVNEKYQGTVSSKEVKGSLKVQDAKGVTSERLLRQAMLKVVGGQIPEVTAERYMAGTNPTAPVLMRVRKGTAPNQLVLTVEGADISVVIDSQGTAERTELQVGSGTVITERIFQRGTF